MLNSDFVRRHFPALSSDWALFDNAGGSVPLRSVIDEIGRYMGTYGVQLGASYSLSQEAGRLVDEGHRAMEKWIGASSGEVVLGPSTTVNLRNLSQSLRPLWQPGDEVIVTDLDHEANVGCWRKLEQTGIRIREWRLRADSAALELEDLEPLLNERTRLVAMTHCSNLVGRIHDISAAAELTHGAGALLCVDGVAYAPHRRVDVGRLGADFYVFSTYKTYGPHQSVLWGRRDLLLEARGQSHYFIGEQEVPYKFEPGGANHELVASLAAIPEYFEELARFHGSTSSNGSAMDGIFDQIADYEQRLAEPLLECLAGRKGVRVIGPAEADSSVRVPTISFVVEGRSSKDIPERMDREKIAVRWGHFYAARAVEALGLAELDGVVRVSMVHYNTAEEVERLVRALDRILPG